MECSLFKKRSSKKSAETRDVESNLAKTWDQLKDLYSSQRIIKNSILNLREIEIKCFYPEGSLTIETQKELDKINEEIGNAEKRLEGLERLLPSKLIQYNLLTHTSSFISGTRALPITIEKGDIVSLLKRIKPSLGTYYNFPMGEKYYKFADLRFLLVSASTRESLIFLTNEAPLDKFIPKSISLILSKEGEYPEKLCLTPEEIEKLDHDVVNYVPGWGYFTTSLEKPFVAQTEDGKILEELVDSVKHTGLRVELSAENPHFFFPPDNHVSLKKRISEGLFICARNILNRPKFFLAKQERGSLDLSKGDIVTPKKKWVLEELPFPEAPFEKSFLEEPSSSTLITIYNKSWRELDLWMDMLLCLLKNLNLKASL